MLNLGKYQGISVSALNKILRGKGSLSGQGKAVAYACKKYNLNEIYLIAHAFLESGYGTSYFSSGRTGVYNYFGIGAYDWYPDNAISYARSRGWTTPAKGIIGGAKFVRQGYISKGQNTLYRMRWNPRSQEIINTLPTYAGHKFRQQQSKICMTKSELKVNILLETDINNRAMC